MAQKTSKAELYIPIATVFSDITAVVLSYLFSYWLRFYSPFIKIFPGDSSVIPPLNGYLFFGIITLPIWIMTFQSFKLYRLNRAVFIFDEFFVVIRCATISLLFSIGVIFFFREFPYSRIVFLLLWASSSVFITFGRYILLKTEKTLHNKGKALKISAVVGISDMADKIYSQFSHDKFAGFNIVGYFAKHPSVDKSAEGKIYLGNYENIPSEINKLEIQRIFIALTLQEHNDLYEIIKICEGINVEFMIVPDFIEMVTSRLRIVEINGIPFMKIKSFPLNIWNRIVKRTFDIVVSFLLIVLSFPLWIVMMIIIKTTSKGPVFYKQERVGLDGKKFEILKFRSMHINAETDGPVFVKKDDDRYTPIGWFLRKYSLDELPQFMNVLKGDMSIVGPRPEREYFINQLKESVEKYLERHRVKCGITGWAQVNGLRGPSTSLKARIEYDVYYIENWSLVFDLKIIIKTIKELFFSKSAY